MAIQAHVAEQNVKAGVVGGVQLGVDMGVLVAADLSSEATARSNVRTDVAKLHTAEKLVGPRVEAALAQADNFLSGASAGSSTSNILALLPGCRGRQLRF